jgi:hydroxypyruvate isomerase
MPRFAANLSFLYKEVPFLERFALAAEDGFKGVEWLFPAAYDMEAVAEQLTRHGLEQVLFNGPPGDWEAGERGIAILPGREAECRERFDQALELATRLRCPRIHLLAGLAPAGVDRQRLHDTYAGNLRHAAARARAHGVSVMIEPINPRSMPGYFLNTQAAARAIVAEVGAPNLQVQMDLFHCQIVEGDLARRIEAQLPFIGHMQVAGVPDRHEPDIGEVNYPWLFDRLDQLGYAGWIGCEYQPRGATRAGLDWVRPWLRAGG